MMFHLPTLPKFYDADRIIEIYMHLNTKIPSDYVVPSSITHCGARACTAGKLWKRSEENRKSDLHDLASADLLRALSKRGIEVDFKDKCKQGLVRAFDNIQRQRERERREAEEEAKMERRRKEEEEAMEEARARKEAYESDWATFIESLKGADEVRKAGAKRQQQAAHHYH